MKPQKKKRMQVTSVRKIYPTLETKKKLVPGVFRILEDRNFLLREHVDAAFEIEDAFKALTKQGAFKLMRWKPKGEDRPAAGFVAHLTDKQQEIITRYFEWFDWLLDHGMERHYSVTMSIVEGYSLGRVDRLYGMRNGISPAPQDWGLYSHRRNVHSLHRRDGHFS